jgi:hypothetical protein
MEGHVGSAAVQAQGCQMLCNLAHDRDGHVTAAQLALAEAQYMMQ